MGGLKACLMCPADKTGRAARGVRLPLSLEITLTGAQEGQKCAGFRQDFDTVWVLIQKL